MKAAPIKIKRESLLQEISGILRQWPQIDRKVFSQAHYCGQSAEAISRTLQLKEEEVRQILKECEHRLHYSLRNFRHNDCGQSKLIASQPARPAA
jgi:hypothetical protein